MTFRPGPLRAAAALAAGFVVVRVVYRVLFDGASGTGPIVLPLPPVRLPAPFAHVVLFGPVTTDGLTDAVASALPIALTILAFGLLNAVVDVPRLFVRGARSGPLSGIARALAIAWATLPSLADAARAVRFAQRLRGERGGVRMLSPLLQRTLERAAGVAAALELRGFAGRGLDGDCRAPVEATDLELGFTAGRGGRSGAADDDGSPAERVSSPRSARRSTTGPAPGTPPRSSSGRSETKRAEPHETAEGGIRVGSLTLATGTLTLVSGPTGSGKSTLLRALAGLHTHTDGGWQRGRLTVAGRDRATVPPRDLARVVGVVLQHPREAFATERVRDEIGLALELRGVAPVIVAARVEEVAARLGITGLLARPTRGISAGEATLVAIAAAIVEHPVLLLVDEPLADLDADARERIAGLLDELAHEAGICVVVAEHRVEPLAALADLRLQIADGVASAGGDDAPVDPRGAIVDPTPFAGMEGASGRMLSTPPGEGRRSHVEASAGTAAGDPGTDGIGRDLPTDSPDPASTTLRAEDITVRHRGVGAVDGASLALRAGEIVALVGPNGAGKSSLLAALALPGRDHRVTAPGRVALVPDASDDLFVFDTVAAECAQADRRAMRGARSRVPEGTVHAEGGSGLIAPREEPHPRQGTAARFAGFLGLDPSGPEFAGRLLRHPRDLSVGERRSLAIAVQLAADPAVLLVDEPTRGLDPAARDLVLAALESLAATGAAVLVASHEPDLAARADRVLTMRAGMLTAAPQPGSAAQPAAAAPFAPRRVDRIPPVEIPSPRTPTHDVAADGRARPTAQAGLPTTPGVEARPGRLRFPDGRRLAPLLALLAANLVALGAFCWPLVASALPEQAEAAVPVVALALAPLAALVALATLDGTVRSAHLLALLGTLAAIGAAVRVASTGVGGVEAVFILLILAGRAFGARFALLLGMTTIALSSVLWGAIGPWTPFQMFACAWVGAVAGLLPRVRDPRLEVAMLCVYGVVASYVFGLLMNLWFWPFAVGFGTGISYDPGAPLGTNLASFLLYSLVTSTLGWDTLRAITTVVGILIIGRPVLAALRRAKPLAAASAPRSASRTPVSAGTPHRG